MLTLPPTRVSVATLTQTAPLADRGTGSSHSAKSPSLPGRNNEACSECLMRSAAFSSTLGPREPNRKCGAVSDRAADLSPTTKCLTFLDAMTCNSSSSQGLAGSCRLLHYTNREHLPEFAHVVRRTTEVEVKLQKLLQVSPRQQHLRGLAA